MAQFENPTSGGLAALSSFGSGELPEGESPRHPSSWLV
jgi:hypothetical protein